MRQVVCKNCGAAFDENLEKCPYCGTMNRKGAYGSFRKRFAGMIDDMFGLRDEASRSVSRMIFTALFRSLILIAVVIGLAFALAKTSNVNYYNDRKEDEKAYETIIWEDENIEKLDEAYENGDFKTIKSLYAENSSVVRNWPHYSDYVLKEKYQTIMEFPYFSYYQLQDVLYFLYYPQFYTYQRNTDDIDMEQYEAMRQDVLGMMNERGYTEEELADIYEKHADKYGYLSISDLEPYVKE